MKKINNEVKMNDKDDQKEISFIAKVCFKLFALLVIIMLTAPFWPFFSEEYKIYREKKQAQKKKYKIHGFKEDVGQYISKNEMLEGISTKEYQKAILDTKKFLQISKENERLLYQAEEQLKDIKKELEELRYENITQLHISHFESSRVAITMSGLIINFISPPGYPPGATNFKTSEYWRIAPTRDQYGKLNFLEWVAFELPLKGIQGAKIALSELVKEKKKLRNSKTEIKEKIAALKEKSKEFSLDEDTLHANLKLFRSHHSKVEEIQTEVNLYFKRNDKNFDQSAFVEKFESVLKEKDILTSQKLSKIERNVDNLFSKGDD